MRFHVRPRQSWYTKHIAKCVRRNKKPPEYKLNWETCSISVSKIATVGARTRGQDKEQETNTTLIICPFLCLCMYNSVCLGVRSQEGEYLLADGHFLQMGITSSFF